MASKFDNHMILRVVLIILAAFVLFGLVSYYNSKQSSVKSETERFFQEFKTDKVNPAPVRDSPLLIQQNNEKEKADAVQPAEEVRKSDFRTVDFSESKLPSDCFPRDRLTAEDLLPGDGAANSKWAQVNPASQGQLSNVNFLSSGFHIGINTVSSSLKNPNLQLRSEPPNPRGTWPIMNSTIEPDLLRRPLELGESC